MRLSPSLFLLSLSLSLPVRGRREKSGRKAVDRRAPCYLARPGHRPSNQQNATNCWSVTGLAPEKTARGILRRHSNKNIEAPPASPTPPPKEQPPFVARFYEIQIVSVRDRFVPSALPPFHSLSPFSRTWSIPVFLQESLSVFVCCVALCCIVYRSSFLHSSFCFQFLHLIFVYTFISERISSQRL